MATQSTYREQHKKPEDHLLQRRSSLDTCISVLTSNLLLWSCWLGTDLHSGRPNTSVSGTVCFTCGHLQQLQYEWAARQKSQQEELSIARPDVAPQHFCSASHAASCG